MPFSTFLKIASRSGAAVLTGVEQRTVLDQKIETDVLADEIGFNLG